MLFSANNLGQLVLKGVQFNNSLAGGSGGCISASGRLGSFSLQSCSATGIKAVAQGGVMELSGTLGSIRIANLTTSGTSVTVGSGGLAFINGTLDALNITGLRAQGCAAGEHGGCLSVQGRATSVSMVSSQIVSATAARSGGALHVLGNVAQLQLSNSSLVECTTSGAGGAVYLAGSLGSVSVAACNLTTNKADGQLGGGALFAELTAAKPPSQFSMERSNCSGNVAQAGGCMSLVVNLNSTTAAGAGLLVNLDSSVVSANSATDRGGGVLLLGTASTQLSVQNCSFGYNKGGTGSSGAAIGSSQLWQPIGGGLHVAGAVKVDLRSSNFQHNSADRGAGGGLVLASPEAELSGKNLYFGSNVAARGSGGSVAAGNDTRVRLDACTFQQDTAQKHGGSLAILSAQASVTSCTFNLCTAYGWGGCAYFKGSREANISSSSLLQGSAGLGGGGLAVLDVNQALVKNCTVEVGPPLLAPADPGLPSQPVRRRSLQQASSSSNSNNTDNCQSVAIVSSSSAIGGGMYVGGRTTAIIAGSRSTISPRSVGWQGAGLGVQLSTDSACKATKVAEAATVDCHAVSMWESIFEAVDGWQPSATERFVFANRLAGWNASCAEAAGQVASVNVSSDATVQDPALGSEAAPAPEVGGVLDLLVDGSAQLNNLRAGNGPHAQLPPCAIRGVEASLLSSLVLLPPVRLALSGPVNVSNSRATVPPKDPRIPAAIFADTTSVFSIGVELHDEGGQLVTVHSRGSVSISSLQSAATLPDILKPSMLGGSIMQLNGGRATLSDLSVRARPGNLTLVITTDLLPNFQLTVQMTVLPCPIDTVPSSSGLQCDQCREDSFGLWSAPDMAPDLVSQGWVSYSNGSVASELDKGGDNARLRCYSCPENAVCPSSAVVFLPAEGYWNSHPLSPIMHRCLFPRACRTSDLGAQQTLLKCQEAWFSTVPPGLAPYVLPDGRLCTLDGNSTALRSNNTGNNSTVSYTELQCVPGYEGPTCGVCSKGWHPAGGGKCSQCKGSAGQHIGVAVIFLTVNLVLVLHTVRTSFAGKRQGNQEDDDDGTTVKVMSKEQQWAQANNLQRGAEAQAAAEEDSIPKPVDFLKLLITHIQVSVCICVTCALLCAA